MRRLRDYLRRRLASAYLSVALSLAALLWLLDLLRRLEDVGRDAGALTMAAWLAARQTPEALIDLLPLWVALASTMALAAMHRDGELTIFRACGLSWRRIAGIAALPALLTALLGLAFLQWGAPTAQQGSKRLTGHDLGQSGLWHHEHGLWARSELEFLNVRRLELGRIPAEIGIYRYNRQGRLIEALDAARAVVLPDGRWRLESVRWRNFDRAGAVALRHLPTLDWPSFLSIEQFELLIRSPGSLPPTDLWRYLEALRRSEQDSGRYALLFWRRLALPLACLGMALVAVSAATTPMRRGGLGARAAIATALGLGYQLLVELISFAGLAAGASAPALALAPTLALLSLGGWLLGRADGAANG